ncbi:hypothetical protein ACFL01_03645, partial [Planctomycetota bacterium]
AMEVNMPGAKRHSVCLFLCIFGAFVIAASAADFPKPYSGPCTERENVFEFAKKPTIKLVGKDKYEIAFAAKGNCDVTIDVVDDKGLVVRHMGAGVLGKNAPAPLQKNTLEQKVIWNGKDDLQAYVKDLDKMRVRVRLGLKPEFDKLLGDGGPKNMPGYIYGLAVGPKAAYVMYKGTGSHGHTAVKEFDHDGNYIATLAPPPANMPEKKLAGWAYVEYEPGKKALHEPGRHDTVARDGFLLPMINGKRSADCQPGLAGDRLFFTSPGNSVAGRAESLLFWIHTDGSTDVEGLKGLPLLDIGEHPAPRLATSPDGKWLYMLMLGLSGGNTSPQTPSYVLRRATNGKEKAQIFIGKSGKPGSDNEHLNNPKGIDCDAKGRIYVADYNNGRIQIFSPDGKYLKTVKVNRPHLVRVHKKTGAIYVIHSARVQGKSLGRVTKYGPFDDPKELFHVDNLTGAAFAVDSWSSKPRLWIAGKGSWVNTGGAFGSGPSVMIWEEQGKTFKKIADFDEDAKKFAGTNYIGRFPASAVGGSGGGGKVVCDPVREEVYWQQRTMFSLKTGAKVGEYRVPGNVDDTIVDRRGYLHLHLNPGFDRPGAVRMDPGQRSADDKNRFHFQEVPYDYGVEMPGKFCPARKGALPLKDQPGAKFFQDGIGVNMMGDVVVNTNIYYVPKMEDHGKDLATAGIKAMQARGEYNSTIGNKYAEFQRMLDGMRKRGEEVFAIPRRPGRPLAGATLWVYDRTGELRSKCAAVVGKHVAGCQIDEDGKLYFVTARPRMVGNKTFLADNCGTYGVAGRSKRPLFTGTLIKSRDKDVEILLKHSIIKLDPPPTRPFDLDGSWVTGAEWFYAGASPIVPGGCTCPTMRAHLDWYKRTFVSESYRHSIGVLDSNGNLIMHIGTYGNYDSWHGPKSKIKVGGDEIGLFIPRMISGTDNYLCFQDWGERLAVLKLNYHTVETTPIQ